MSSWQVWRRTWIAMLNEFAVLKFWKDSEKSLGHVRLAMNYFSPVLLKYLFDYRTQRAHLGPYTGVTLKSEHITLERHEYLYK